jgi:hypothetical protein
MIRVGHPCGLFNRLDVIATGYVLAAMHGDDRIEVLWPRNDRHMPVGFEDLFTALPAGRVVEREIDPEVSREYLAAQAALPIDYRTSVIYGQALRRVLDRAAPEVQHAVSEFVGTHFAHEQQGRATTVGVHVRRSEAPLPVCPYAQPLRYYEAIMRSFPPGTRFFISTDSQEAFRWLAARFRGRVFQREKTHDNRSSVDGVREGLIDMLLLSRCSAIIGTFGSSFSGAAAVAAAVPILPVRAVPRVPAGWPHFDHRRWLWAYRHFVVEATFWQCCYFWRVRPQLARVPRVPRRVARAARSYGALVSAALARR